MSLLSGFDAVFEVGRPYLRGLLLGDPRVAALRPPFEQAVALPADGGGGALHVVVVDADVFLRPGALVELRLTFERLSVIGNSALRGLLAGRDLTRQRGTVRVTLPVTLAPGMAPGARDLVLGLAAAATRVVFDPPARGDPPNTRTAQGIVGDAMAEQVTRQVRAMGGDVRAALPFRVDPTVPASLAPLVVRDAQLRVLAPDDPARQALAVYLTLDPATAGRADERAERALPAGVDVGVALSPGAFHRFVFTPAVQTALGAASRDALPPTCGPATSIPYPALPDWRVTRVADDLRDGAVGVQLRAENPSAGGGAFGSTLQVDLRGHLAFTVDAGGRVVPAWHTDSVDAWHDYGWGWWLVGIFGPYVTMGVAEIITHAVAAGAASGLVPGLGAVDAPLAVPGARMTVVEVTAEHFALFGRAAAMPAASAAPRLTLTSQVTTDQRTAGAAGVYDSQACPVGRYAYTTTLQRQAVTVTPAPRFAARPVTYAWELSAISPPARVAGRGAVTLQASRDVPDPPPGTRTPVADVTQAYAVADDGAALTLSAGPEAGNYACTVRCTATDAEGRVLTQLARASFTTHDLAFEPRWAEDLAVCVRGIAAGLARVRGLERAFLLDGPLGPVGPGPVELVARTALDPQAAVGLWLAQALTGKRDPALTRHVELAYGSQLATVPAWPAALSAFAARGILAGGADQK